MKKALPFLCAVLLACGDGEFQGSADEKPLSLPEGHWLFNLDIGDRSLPFNAFFSKKNDSDVFVVRNADEVIATRDIELKNDSLFIEMPVFGTYLKGKMISDTVFRGVWTNTTKSANYHIPFTAILNREERFSDVEEEVNYDFSGKWQVAFSEGTEDFASAVGLFNQNGNRVTGTFLTEAGDYRFLEGVSVGRTMKLSSFDGAHAFLFEAEVGDNGELTGLFYSGTHWKENWTAKRNESFELTHPDSITFTTGKYDPNELNFQSLNGDPVSMGDERFRNKVVIMTVMGTWCPNCADESRDMSRLYNRYKNRGLEVVGVDYEKGEEVKENLERIERFKNEIKADYLFLYAGKLSGAKIRQDFHFLNGISSYPTAIFIDRKGSIRKIHTGYYGPGTGNYHHRFLEEIELFVEKLLSEEFSS